ncbi:TonB-dependent receptor [Lacibacter sp. MH-610]|uniref:TonB-dependent receptor plug domain-containing protein n=1 Tax=Lacibacter sp. MH-610 TaxID=3020883 RepID=UPI003891CF76
MNAGILLAFYLLLITSTVIAQEDTTVQSLSEVVVSATRTQQQEIQLPYVTNTIKRKELNRFQPRTTPEALNGMTGVFVQKTNHGGGSAFIRGLTGNQTLLLIDGIRLNNSTFRFGPNQYLNTIDMFTIQQIEVVKGTGSVQYGSDALGGTIQVLTKDAVLSETKKWDGAAQAKFMSAGMEQTGRGEFNYSSSKLAVTGGITYRNFGNLLSGDTTGFQNPSGYKELAYDVKLKFLLKQNIELTTAHQLLQQKNVPVFHKVRLENFLLNEMDPQQRMLSYAKLKIQNTNPLIKTIEFTASHQQTKEGRNSQKNGSAVLRKEFDKVNTFGFTADVQSVYNKYWSSSSGIDLYMDKVNSIRDDINTITQAAVSKRGLYPDESVYGNYSLFSLHQLQWRKLRVHGGIRYNLFSISLSDTSLGKVQLNPAAFVFNAGLVYNITAHQFVFASFNNSFRAPNVDDMGTLGIVDFRYELPAYNLNPERSYNYEAGYKFRSSKFNLTATAFYMQLQQLITRVRKQGEQISGYNVYIKENTDRAFIRGAEAEADVELMKGFRLQGGVAHAYGQNKTRNEPLRRIPPFNGRLRSTYTNNKWFAAAEYWFASKQNRLAQGDKDDNRIPQGGTPGFNVFNTVVGYELKQVRVQTGLQNLFNKDYRTHGSGMNGYGRSAWLHIQFMF